MSSTIISDLTVHLRPDRSITQMMLENKSNADPAKVISEDILTGKTITYGQLREDAFKAAFALRHRMGMKGNDTVTIIGRSCVDYIVAAHAIWAAGGVVSTINHSSTPKELVHAINIIQPKFFIVDASVEPKLREALAQTEYKSATIMTLIERVDNLALFPDDLLVGSRRIEAEAYVLDGKDARTVCAALVLSSGTTGLPKAVMLSHYNLTAILSHIYGLYVCALMGPWLGYYVCLVPSFDLDTYCRLLQDKQATLARLVPPVALMLAENPIVQKYSYSTLEYFSCSAAPLKPLVASKLQKRFPHVSLCQTYGCTELSSCVSQSGVRDKDAPLVSGGSLLANMKVRFIDDHCHDVKSGEPGEICVSAPSIMMGYKDNEAATQEAMLEPGWYRTGDIGYLDAKGYLIIIDRIKDVIKYKGFQISPTELEEIIGQHPSVADSGVTSVWDDSEATEIPQAFVVPVSGTFTSERAGLAKEIQDMVAAKVAGYKKLRGGVRFIDQLPRNPTGKLLRRELRQKASLKAHL
ncbi:hypothetical protein FE257_006275 [Aspergillus nanangensis]|uniref:Uncharacterized protein n=1 Tax=Aspergillus nanangensis TaxID=2582783 RepID=A0AAD4GU00_ASPNN|nr:hypothetical protein FE257_006275 [Aspergillus nanangensis]